MSTKCIIILNGGFGEVKGAEMQHNDLPLEHVEVVHFIRENQHATDGSRRLHIAPARCQRDGRDPSRILTQDAAGCRRSNDWKGLVVEFSGGDESILAVVFSAHPCAVGSCIERDAYWGSHQLGAVAAPMRLARRRRRANGLGKHRVEVERRWTR
jgi:hypothetical protein